MKRINLFFCFELFLLSLEIFFIENYLNLILLLIMNGLIIGYFQNYSNRKLFISLFIQKIILLFVFKYSLLKIANNNLKYIFFFCLSIFHMTEYIFLILNWMDELSHDSFLIYHSKFYQIALFLSLVEMNAREWILGSL